MKNLCALLLVLISSFALSQPSTAEQATQDLIALYRGCGVMKPSLEEVRALVANGADINREVPEAGVSVLQRALIRHWTRHVGALLGASDPEVDPCAHWKTALLHAVTLESVKLTRMLMEAGADADTPFEICVSVSPYGTTFVLPKIGENPIAPIVGTPLVCAALMSPQLISVLDPYVRIDQLNYLPDSGWITELEFVVLYSSKHARSSIQSLLALGASVDRLSETSRQKMNDILPVRGRKLRWQDSSMQTYLLRRHETLNDIERLSQYLSQLPRDLPEEGRENLERALLNAVRSDLLDAAHLLWGAGASRRLALKWLLRHQNDLSKGQQQLLTELSPSRFLAGLRQDRSSLISDLPLDVVRLIGPFAEDEGTPPPPPMPPAAAAAMTL